MTDSYHIHGRGDADPLGAGDDIVATFQLERSTVRGRITRLGDATIDSILKRHAYPRWAAHALGEAITLAVLTAATLKVDGRILVQAEGDGPVSMLVAEARTDGGVRGYLKLNRDAWARLETALDGRRPKVAEMIGQGVLALMIVQDQSLSQPYQGVVPLDGDTLGDCAEHYFAQSEQIPTRVKLSVADFAEPGGTKAWRAGGAIIQQVAADNARGETSDDWDHANALFDTLTDAELTDAELSTGRLLFRLFHEEGVRLEPSQSLLDSCTCSAQRLSQTLRAMPAREVREMADEDGMLVADCQFCGRIYRIPADDVAGGV